MDRSPRPVGASTSFSWVIAGEPRGTAPAITSPSVPNRTLDVSRGPSTVARLEDVPAQPTVQCIDRDAPRRDKGAQRRHTQIVARFEALCERALTEPLHLADICAAIGVSARTLEYCCKEYYGIGACRYLRLRRMGSARRALLAASVGSATVTEIATHYGFWELGRFSTTYRDLFGELPSVTLRHKSDDVQTMFR